MKKLTAKALLKEVRKLKKQSSIEPGSLNWNSELICDVLGSKHTGLAKEWNDRSKKVQVEFPNGQVLGISYDDVAFANPIIAPFDPNQMLRQLGKEISKMKFPKSMPVTKIYLDNSHPHGAKVIFTGYQSSKVTQRIGKLKIMKDLGFEYSPKGGVQGSLVLKDGSGYNYTIEFFSAGRSSRDTDLWYEDAYQPKRNQWGW